MTDWAKITASKEAYREKLRRLPVVEKLKIVEILMQRARGIRRAK